MLESSTNWINWLTEVQPSTGGILFNTLQEVTPTFFPRIRTDQVQSSPILIQRLISTASSEEHSLLVNLHKVMHPPDDGEMSFHPSGIEILFFSAGNLTLIYIIITGKDTKKMQLTQSSYILF